MLVSEVGKWNKSPNIMLISSVTLAEVMDATKEILRESFIPFLLYGGMDGLMQDDDKLSDYDIFVTDVKSMVEYITSQLMARYDSLVLHVVGAIHKNTIRIMATKTPICDVTYVPITFFNFALYDSINLDDTKRGRLVGKLFRIADLLKFIFGMNIPFCMNPHIKTHQTKKWKKGIDNLEVLLDEYIPYIHGGGSNSPKKFEIRSDITYGGLIGLAIMMAALDVPGVKIETFKSKNILIIEDLDGPLTYFATQRETTKNVSADFVYNDIFFNLVYVKPYDEWVYKLEVLPPQYGYISYQFGYFTHKVVYPYYMLAESILFRAFLDVEGTKPSMESDLGKFYNGCMDIMKLDWESKGVRSVPSSAIMSKDSLPLISHLMLGGNEFAEKFQEEHKLVINVRPREEKKIILNQDALIGLFEFQIISEP